MKKIVAFLVLAAASLCSPQTTPHMALNIPSHDTPGWDVLLNNYFSALDKFLGGLVGCAVHQVTVFNGSAWTCQTKPTLDVRDFSGASVGAQIDAACTSLGGSAGVVWIPSTVGSGNSIIGVPPLCTIWDIRPFNAWPHVAEPAGHGLMLGYTAPSTQGTSPQGYSTLGLLFRNPSGGLDSYASGKNVGQALDITYTSNTSTQDYPLVLTGYKEGEGDFLGGNVAVQHNGNCLAEGNECTKGWKVQAGQGNSVETPTVTAYNASTHVLTISGISNPNVLNFGSSRLMLDTVAGKMYTTGTVTSIGGGTNPTVTLAGGANLNSVPGVSTLPQSGAGYCFSQSADDNPSYSGVHYVVPILEFLTSTTLSLNLTAQGQANIYPGLLTGSASFRIYQCATIQDSALNSATTIQTDGSTSAFAATDTLEIPIGWAQAMTGEHIVVSASLPQMFNNVSELITPGVYSSQIWNVLSGYVAQGFLFQNNWCSYRTASSCIPTSQPFMEFQHTPPRIMVQTDVTPPDNYTLYNIFDPVGNSTFTHISSTQNPVSGPYFS